MAQRPQWLVLMVVLVSGVAAASGASSVRSTTKTCCLAANRLDCEIADADVTNSLTSSPFLADEKFAHFLCELPEYIADPPEKSKIAYADAPAGTPFLYY